MFITFKVPFKSILLTPALWTQPIWATAKELQLMDNPNHMDKTWDPNNTQLIKTKFTIEKLIFEFNSDSESFEMEKISLLLKYLT